MLSALYSLRLQNSLSNQHFYFRRQWRNNIDVNMDVSVGKKRQTLMQLIASFINKHRLSIFSFFPFNHF